jgi:hypothetical protein
MRDITPVTCTTDGITGRRVIASPKWSRLCLGGSLGTRDDPDGGSCSADVIDSMLNLQHPRMHGHHHRVMARGVWMREITCLIPKPSQVGRLLP